MKKPLWAKALDKGHIQLLQNVHENWINIPYVIYSTCAVEWLPGRPRQNNVIVWSPQTPSEIISYMMGPFHKTFTRGQISCGTVHRLNLGSPCHSDGPNHANQIHKNSELMSESSILCPKWHNIIAIPGSWDCTLLSLSQPEWSSHYWLLCTSSHTCLHSNQTSTRLAAVQMIVAPSQLLL